MTVPEITCFHIGLLVADIEKTISNYKRFLGDGPWRMVDMPAGGRIAYGSAAGQTWELLQVTGPGNTRFHQFRDQHGEGVQHIGFWTPDLRASVESALAAGARLTSLTTDAHGNAAIQIKPAADVTAEQLDALGMAPWKHIDLASAAGNWSTSARPLGRSGSGIGSRRTTTRSS